jgi:hypothetical protein
MNYIFTLLTLAHFHPTTSLTHYPSYPTTPPIPPQRVPGGSRGRLRGWPRRQGHPHHPGHARPVPPRYNPLHSPHPSSLLTIHYPISLSIFLLTILDMPDLFHPGTRSSLSISPSVPLFPPLLSLTFYSPYWTCRTCSTQVRYTLSPALSSAPHPSYPRLTHATHV